MIAQRDHRLVVLVEDFDFLRGRGNVEVERARAGDERRECFFDDVAAVERALMAATDFTGAAVAGEVDFRVDEFEIGGGAAPFAGASVRAPVFRAIETDPDLGIKPLHARDANLFLTR